MGGPATMIVCAMIVGPGEGDRYLARTLDTAAAWADHIVVVTDHVDQATTDVIDRERIVPTWSFDIANPDVTFRSDESQVRNALLTAIDAQRFIEAGDLIVVLDADEELCARVDTVRTALMGLRDDTLHGAWSIDFFHLWVPDGSMYRTDGGWRPAPQFRVYRHMPGARIEPRTLACTAIPPGPGPRRQAIELYVKHWSYARIEDRKRKHDLYMQIDGGCFHNPRHLESILDPRPTLAAID